MSHFMTHLKNWVLVVRKPSAILEVKFFENEEFEIDDIEDATLCISWEYQVAFFGKMPSK